MTAPVRTNVARFGVFELDLDTLELSRQGRKVRLPLQPARMLAALVSARGTLVTREQLVHALWGGDTFVDYDNGLAACLTQIRTAIGDRAASPRFIETLPRRGYRFIADVSLGEAPPAPPPPPSRQRRVTVPLAMMSLSVAASVAVVFTLSSARGDVPTLAVLPVETSDSSLDATAVTMTETIIARLVPIVRGSAIVLARQETAVLREAASLDRIRRAGVEYFVDVSIRPLDARLRVHAKLAHQSGWILWTRDYEVAEDFAAIQQTIAEAIARSVAREFGRADGSASRPPRSEALSAYATGNARLEQGRLDEAANAFGAARRLDPSHEGTYARLIETSLWSALDPARDLDAAIREAAQLVSDAGSSRDASAAVSAARGLLAHARGESALAIGSLHRAVALDPDFTAARLWLGRAYLAAGDRKLAETEMRRAAAGAHLEPQALAEIAKLALATGAYEIALTAARQLRAIAPDWSVGRLLMAYARDRTSDTHGAAIDLSEFLSSVGLGVPARADLDEMWRLANSHPAAAGALFNPPAK